MMNLFPASNEGLTHLEPVVGNPGAGSVRQAAPYGNAYTQPGEPYVLGLSDYLRILARRKFTIILISLLGAVLGFLIAQRQTPRYRARTLIEIYNLNPDFLNSKTVSPTANEPLQSPDYTIRTQMIILQSRPVLASALASMDLEARLLETQRAPKTVWPWRKAPDAEAAPPVPLHELALATAETALSVRAEPNARVIEATFSSTDPKLSADAMNAIVAAFAKQNQKNRQESSVNTRKWLSAQLADLRAKLEQDEQQLQEYAQRSNLTFFSDKDNAADDRLRQLQVDVLKAHSDRVAKQSAYEIANSAPPETLPEVLDDPTLKEYQVQLTALRRQQAELSSMFTPEHPKMVTAQAQVDAVNLAFQNKRSNVLMRIRNDYDAAVKRENLLASSYEGQLALVSQNAVHLAHYSILQRELDTTRQLYDSMIGRVREAGLASAMQASEIHTIEAATPPSGPYAPNLKLQTIFGLLAGLLAAVAGVLYSVRPVGGFEGPRELSVALNVPQLGVIPTGAKLLSAGGRLSGRTPLRMVSGTDTQRPELVTWHQSLSVVAESFRLTLTSILLTEKHGAKSQVIAVSSANPQEGKTTVASNLAIVLASVNRRVLLVDGDLRKPRLHNIFKIDNRTGLAGALLSGKSLPIQASGLPGLSLLPAGANPNESLFFTGGLSRLLEQLRKEFDMILIDTPPLLHVSDARLISSQADAVLLVVAPQTSKDAVLLAQQRLAEDGSHLMGTILNNWDPQSSGYQYNEYGSVRPYQKS